MSWFVVIRSSKKPWAGPGKYAFFTVELALEYAQERLWNSPTAHFYVARVPDGALVDAVAGPGGPRWRVLAATPVDIIAAVRHPMSKVIELTEQHMTRSGYVYR